MDEGEYDFFDELRDFCSLRTFHALYLTIMDPLTPNDPLWKLLGKAKPVQLRTDFTQDVVRAARQMPQERGWWPSLRASAGAWLAGMQRPALAAVTALVVVTLATMWLEPSSEAVKVAQGPAVSTSPAVADEDLALISNGLDIPLDGINHMDALVAMDDTSALTDTEIAFLLY